MLTNDVDIVVTDADVASSITGINAIRTTLAPYLIESLTPEQRKSIFKMGPDSLQYVTENYNYAQDPDLVAPTVDVKAWNNDITANSQLQQIFNALEPLYFDLFDMMMITGSEAMEEAQANYRYLRYQAAEGAIKARGAYEALKALRWNKVTHRDTPPVAGSSSASHS